MDHGNRPGYRQPSPATPHINTPREAESAPSPDSEGTDLCAGPSASPGAIVYLVGIPGSPLPPTSPVAGEQARTKVRTAAPASGWAATCTQSRRGRRVAADRPDEDDRRGVQCAIRNPTPVDALHVRSPLSFQLGLLAVAEDLLVS